MAESRVGVLGASSLVGRCVLPLLRIARRQVVAFSRKPVDSTDGVEWRELFPSLPAPHLPNSPQGVRGMGCWICVAPIWVLPEYFSLIEASGARRVVALSSTSRFTKVVSGDTAENAIAAKLIDAEARVQAWAESRGTEWVVLRPTLIYGQGRDKNISEMARFIRRSHQSARWLPCRFITRTPWPASSKRSCRAAPPWS